MRMQEEELDQLLKAHGWRLLRRQRGGKDYFYAQRVTAQEVYVSPTENLSEVQPEEVLEKIKKATGGQ